MSETEVFDADDATWPSATLSNPIGLWFDGEFIPINQKKRDVLRWSLRVAVFILVLATWVLMVVIATRVNEIRDELYRHPRIVVEVDEGVGDA